ncbi:MAG: beta-glucosidase [Alphaproteobacteria bacterium]|nr:beta-glucosidase [Alphaproteobacteria bacterium]
MNRRRLLQAATAATALAGTVRASRAAEDQKPHFPRDFLWGTSTSAYQIEGRGDRSADCIWDSFCRLPGTIRDGSNGDIACDDYHRFLEDIALLAGAGLKAYRFSIQWPRVLPEGAGEIAQSGLDFYSRLADALLEAGIEPWACLYHWDLPQALQDRGGWLERSIADRFVDYATLMAGRLGDRITRWAMFNEPNVHAIIGHGLGEHAPGLRGRQNMFAAMHHQNLAQGRALAALRQAGGGKLQLGTVLSLQPVLPAEGLDANTEAARMWDAVWNRAYLDPLFHGSYPERLAADLAPLLRPDDLAAISQPIDFLGINYYSRMHQKADPDGLVGSNWGALPTGTKTTGMGWSIEPDGLYEMLIELRDRYGNPAMFVTENGASFHDEVGPSGRVEDGERIAFLRDHLAACHRALAEGVNLHGYFVWTILDNFEWAFGYTQHFGLVQVDRDTLKRVPKASYDWFAAVARSGVAD